MAPCYKKQTVLVWLLAVPALCSLQEEELSLLLERQIPKWQERFHVPGASVALIESAQLVWVKGFGKAGAGDTTPVRPSTIFRAGPVSTTLTAWAVMKLAEQGHIDLNEPIGSYLRRWQLPSSRYDHRAVTIRRLLLHSAGIAEIDYPSRNALDEVPELKSLLSGIADDLPPIHLTYSPGTQFKYSKAGFSLLEMLIEDVTGQDYARFMEQEIFQPLDMRSSYYEKQSVSESQCALPHNHLGLPVSGQYEDQRAAEGLYTTTIDLARFVVAGLPNLRYEVQGYPLINRRLIEVMQQPGIRLSGIYQLRADSHTLAYFAEKTESGMTILSNGGYKAPGWNSYFFAYPQTGDGLVVLTNGHNGMALIHAIARQWADSRKADQPKVIKNLTLGKRYLWSAIIGSTVLFLFGITFFLRDLSSRRIATSFKTLRLPLLLAIGAFGAFIWADGRQLLLDWYPYLSPWPLVSLSAFLAIVALLISTERR